MFKFFLFAPSPVVNLLKLSRYAGQGTNHDMLLKLQGRREEEVARRAKERGSTLEAGKRDWGEVGC
jgi:hypothetical protein